MKPILTETQDTIVVVRLNRGVTNALNLDLLHALDEALDQARKDPNVRGLVLASTSEKFFSIGFDIPQLYDLTKSGFEEFYKTFNRVCLDLFTLPKPTVAAITGHAVAGGCILTLCCDYRFIAEGKKLMGLNEIKLGVPVPYLADSILRSIVGVPHAREIMESGDFYRPEHSLQMGMVDQVMPLQQVLSKAVEKAQLLGSLPQEAFALIKRNRVETIETNYQAHQEEKEKSFIRCWYSDQARQRPHQGQVARA